MLTRCSMLYTLLLCSLCMTIAVASAQAPSDEAMVMYRQKVMSSQGASMGAIGDIVKNKLPFQAHITMHAQDIQAMSTLIADAFKQKVTEGKTDAKPELWQEWEKFTAAAKTLQDESGKLAQVATAGDMEAISAQVKKLGDACGNCHKPYRKPKEESYKNKP